MRSAIFFMALSAGSLFAQADPPSRVARVNLVEGEVSFLESGTAEWVAAPLNRPLTIGDAIWTESGARAELHIGSAALRLAPETSFSFLNLDDATVQLRLAQGSLNVRLRDLDDGEVFEVDTPNVAFRLTRPGSYRFDVRPDGSASRILVWAGEVDALAGNQQFSLRARDCAEVSGWQEISYNVTAVPAPDSFDEWTRARDRREDRAASARYLSRDVTGYEDLDDYGDWRQVDDYGPVWVPRVDVGWSPYQTGHWVWIDPWGWTWVDDAPWGYAPFHYGRWVYVGGGWAWVPGPLGPGYRHPVYAPALVVWVGGPRWQAGVSFGGGIGWFPLGPGEVYHPHHRYSERYFTRVNSTNARLDAAQLNNAWRNRDDAREARYRNQQAPHAVTVVSRPDFERGRNAGRSAVNLPAGAVDQAPIARPNEAWFTSRPARLAQQTPAARRPPDSAVRPVVTRAEVPAASGRMVRTPAQPATRSGGATSAPAEPRSGWPRDDIRRAAEPQPAGASGATPRDTGGRQGDAERQARQEQERRQEESRQAIRDAERRNRQADDARRQVEQEQERRQDAARQAAQREAEQRARQADDARRQQDAARQAAQREAEQQRARQADESRRQADRQREAEQERSRQADESRRQQEAARQAAERQRSESKAAERPKEREKP